MIQVFDQCDWLTENEMIISWVNIVCNNYFINLDTISLKQWIQNFGDEQNKGRLSVCAHMNIALDKSQGKPCQTQMSKWNGCVFTYFEIYLKVYNYEN